MSNKLPFFLRKYWRVIIFAVVLGVIIYILSPDLLTAIIIQAIVVVLGLFFEYFIIRPKVKNSDLEPLQPAVVTAKIPHTDSLSGQVNISYSFQDEFHEVFYPKPFKRPPYLVINGILGDITLTEQHEDRFKFKARCSSGPIRWKAEGEFQEE